MSKVLNHIFKLYKQANVSKKAGTIEQQINDKKYSIDTENYDANKLLEIIDDIVYDYDVIKQALDMAKNQKEDEFAVYTLSSDKNKIVNLKYIKKDDVYDYKPNQNEYALVGVRDTGFIDTDYQLQPMIMVVRSWNERRNFYSSKKKNVVKKANEKEYAVKGTGYLSKLPHYYITKTKEEALKLMELMKECEKLWLGLGTKDEAADFWNKKINREIKYETISPYQGNFKSDEIQNRIKNLEIVNTDTIKVNGGHNKELTKKANSVDELKNLLNKDDRVYTFVFSDDNKKVNIRIFDSKMGYQKTGFIPVEKAFDIDALMKKVNADGKEMDAEKKVVRVSKTTKLNKKAEEDLIEVGWGLYTNDEYEIKDNALYGDDKPQEVNETFWNKINNEIDKVESWFLKEGYKKFFTKVRDEGHGKDSELGGTAWMTENQLKDFMANAEQWDTEFVLAESSGTLDFGNIPVDYNEALSFKLKIYVDDKDLDELGIESKKNIKNKKQSSKAKAMKKRAYSVGDYLAHFNDVQQYALVENKGDLGKAVEDLLTFASSEYDKKNFPREYVYKLVKKYIDDTVKFQEMINHPIKEDYIVKAKELLNNYKVENKIASKTNKLQKKATKTLEEVAGLIDTILDDFDHYGYSDTLEVDEFSGYERILADLQKDEKKVIEETLNYIAEDDSDEPFTSKELDELKAYYNSKFGKTATKKQAEEKAKPILVDAYYYKYLEDIDRYVREKIEDRQYAYIEYPKDEYERKITVDDIKDKLNFLAEHYFTLDRKTKKGDKIVITNHATGEELGEKEYTGEKLAKRQNKLSKSATIKHEKGVYNVYSESGKCLGKGYKTKEEAEKRLKQVEYFKNKKSSLRRKAFLIQVSKEMVKDAMDIWQSQLSLYDKKYNTDEEIGKAEIEQKDKEYNFYVKWDYQYGNFMNRHNDTFYKLYKNQISIDEAVERINALEKQMDEYNSKRASGKKSLKSIVISKMAEKKDIEQIIDLLEKKYEDTLFSAWDNGEGDLKDAINEILLSEKIEINDKQIDEIEDYFSVYFM